MKTIIIKNNIKNNLLLLVLNFITFFEGLEQLNKSNRIKWDIDYLICGDEDGNY